MNGADTAKALVRRAAGLARQQAHAAPDAAERAAAAQAHLAAFLAPLGPVSLAGYLAIRSELDPLPVMAAHPGAVAVPVIEGQGLPLRFRRWTPEAVLVPGALGVSVPEQGEEILPEAVIVPLLAWDRRGFRMGYGGGFYDRTLAALRARGPVLAVGFAFSGQELPDVPVDGFDQRLDAVVTEQGVLRFS